MITHSCFHLVNPSDEELEDMLVRLAPDDPGIVAAMRFCRWDWYTDDSLPDDPFFLDELIHRDLQRAGLV